MRTGEKKRTMYIKNRMQSHMEVKGVTFRKSEHKKESKREREKNVCVVVVAVIVG